MGRTTNGRVSPQSPRYGTAVDKVARRAKRRKTAAAKRVDEVSPKVEVELRIARHKLQQAIFDALVAEAGGDR